MKPPNLTLLEHLRRMTSPPATDAVLLDRWVHQRDEQAFASLVARHGPMVLGVCRRILGDVHEAEDALQATFLILSRKAASLRRPEALACWLHGVAARLAYKSRTAARRRAGHSRPLAAEPVDSQPDPLELLSVREMLGLIDKEIAALREVYRLPVVLCDLEGRTQEEAAGLLGWTLGSLRGRLLRGRAQLKARLGRRGLTLPAGIALPLVGAALSESMPAAGPVVAPQLVASVTQAAVRFSAESAAMGLSGPAFDLAKEGLRILTLAKVKIAAAMVLTMTVFVAGAGLLSRQLWQAKPAEECREAKPPPAANVAPKPAETPQVRRDQFGDPLPEGAVARLGTVRLRHGREVRSVAFSPDGKTLASGGQDNTVRVWEIATGKELRRFTGLTGLGSENSWASSIAFAPDGKFLAAGTMNGPGEVVIWELATGKESRPLRMNRAGVESLVFSPDGKILAAATQDALIHLWHANTRKPIRQLKGHQNLIESITISADGKMLASASRDKTVRLWDLATGRELRQLKGHTDMVLAVAFAPDGKSLASGGWDNTIRLWDVANGKEFRILKGHSGAVDTLVFLPDGKTLASGSWDLSVRLWDKETGKELHQMQSHRGTVTSIAVSPDGRMLASGSWDRIVSIWDAATGKELRPAVGSKAGLWAVAITPDSQRVATGGEDGVIRIWDAPSGKELLHLIEPFKLPSGGTLSLGFDDRLQFSANGKTVNASNGSGLGRWDAKTGKSIEQKHYDAARIMYATPDGKFVVGREGHENLGQGNVLLLDAGTGKKLRQFKTHKRFSVSAISPDSKHLACGTPQEDGTVAVWELATGKERCRCKGAHHIAYALAFSPDSKYLAGSTANIRSYTPETPIYLWDAATGQEVRHFQARGHYVRCLDYSADGRMLVSGGGDKTIRLWETATGKERRRFEGHQGNINSIAFSADGTRLVSASEDTTALVWDATAPIIAAKPTAKQLQAAWSDLASDDAAEAYHAIWLLARHPAQSVPLFREHVSPARALDAEMRKQVDRWLAELDSDKAEVRERAGTELERIALNAEPMLRKALTGRPSLEQRKRIERVMEHLEREKVTLGRALEALEHAHTPESRQFLEALAAGEAEAWLTREARTVLQRR